jgi:uncharacterized protein YjbI with pentapeptide repeats
MKTDKNTVTVNITSRWDSSNILFSAEVGAEIAENLRVKVALEIGVNARAYLARANLAGANLARANLAGANLAGANLDGANLAGANLDGANLDGAYLARANLAGAYLARANLDGANLDGANLDGAYLARANLDGANLDGANLDGANLAGANLDGANLDGAYLAGADLAGAYLAGAYLARANLDGAYLDDKSVLTGERPIFMLGPIGSESRTFVAYITASGLRLRAGCFFGTREQFLAKLDNKHGMATVHAREYHAALAMIDAHCKLWTPKADETEAAA